MTHITEITDEALSNELNKCEIAKVLLSATAYKKQWLAYKNAVMAEMNRRNEPYNNLTDDELLSQLAG